MKRLATRAAARTGLLVVIFVAAAFGLSGCEVDDTGSDATQSQSDTAGGGNGSGVSAGCEPYLTCCTALTMDANPSISESAAEDNCRQGILDSSNLNNEPSKCQAEYNVLQCDS